MKEKPVHKKHKHVVTLPVHPDHPVLETPAEEVVPVVCEPAPVEECKITPLTAPIKLNRYIVKPFTPWLGLGTPCLILIPMEGDPGLPAVHEDGQYADVHIIPPGDLSPRS